MNNTPIDQLLRYKRGVQEVLSMNPKINIEIYCHLVAPKISSGHYINNSVNNLRIVTYEYSLHGIKFKSNFGGWFKGSGDLTFNDIKNQFVNA